MSDNTSAFHALEYDEKIKKTLPYYEDFYKQVIDFVKIRFDKSLTWLDVGCGTGKMAEVAFRTVAIEKFVFCDNSVNMIEIAKQRFESENAEFTTSSILELRNTISFDVITAIQVFHYFAREERISAIKKCYEMLQPNGIFVTFENFAPYSEVGKKLFLERWKLYQLSQGKDIDECSRHIGRYGKEYFPISISEHLNVLKQCGFENVEIIWVSNMQVGLLGIK
ncbi:MAG: methyltransferase domain-containing protein [Lachnospiraceae bacterium]|nr:methyltransferase domain-containing protein [Lachnospiraceae bacterium]